MFNLCCANFLLSHQKLFAAAKCILPICEICEFAKARFNPREQSCQPMMVVLRDLYVLAKSRLLGQQFNSCWGPSADEFFGGCIFVDHTVGILDVEHQVGFLQ